MEITHALRTNEEAHFEPLHQLVAIASARKRRRSSVARRKSMKGTSRAAAAAMSALHHAADLGVSGKKVAPVKGPPKR